MLKLLRFHRSSQSLREPLLEEVPSPHHSTEEMEEEGTSEPRSPRYSMEEEKPKSRGSDITVYVAKDKRGVPCSILRKFPNLTEVRGTLLVHNERGLLTTITWMVKSCGPQVSVNLVGQAYQFLDKILEYSLSFLIRWSEDPAVNLEILTNGKHLLKFRREIIHKSVYRILEVGTSKLRVYSGYQKILTTSVYDGVRGVEDLDLLSKNLRYYEGTITSELLPSLFQKFPSLEHVVGEGKIDYWISPVSVLRSLRTLQVWVPDKEYQTIFKDCPGLSLLQTEDSRGKTRTRRPRK